MMNAHILSIGNELLIGDTVNTNAAWLGRFLTEQGFYVEQVTILSDEEDAIRNAIRQSLSAAKLVISTGGLGPTHDDITKKVVADLFDSELVEDGDILQSIRERAERRGIVMTPARREQAMVPDSCEAMPNARGTAPGLWFDRGESVLVLLPGVPYEMRYLMEHGVKPRLSYRYPDREVYATRYLKTAGVAESTLSDEVIGDLKPWLGSGNGVAYLPSPAGVTIRISRSGRSAAEAEEQLEPLLQHIRTKASRFIYGEGRDATLEEVLGSLLRKKELSLAVAESCTGGLVSDALTDVPGSSDYFRGGVVAYDNAVKMSELGVRGRTLDKYGAVSKEAALEMARGVAERLGTDIGISTTGIAGPSGGTDEKPVGTVWTGYWIRGDHFALHSVFGDDRRLNKLRTTTLLLETVRRKLLGIDPIPYELTPFRP
ncbi:MAG: competence/damage-inducible protein A [Balneolaceae bacterium]